MISVAQHKVVREVKPEPFLRSSDALYPAGLSDLALPPARLYWLGDLAILDAPRVAIVGTRDCTSAGERAARMLTRAFVRAGATVISGMARGIDAAAHRAALDEGGKTVAVLGTGIDVPYPVGHTRLHREIVERGLVVSENAPGSSAHPGAFPRRNRIIAALSELVIVVEAGFKSGALNTAAHALELGRPLAAVPGPMDCPKSAGSNLLLRDGADFIASEADALALLKLTHAPLDAEPELDDPERQLWSVLETAYRDVDWLARRSKLPTADCLATISALEVRGLVESSVSGEIRRR